MRKLLIGTAVLGLVLVACAQTTQRQAQPPKQQPQEEPAGPVEIAVTAQEYAFVGIPASIEAGRVTFVLQNQGKEKHMLDMARLKGGKSVEELLQLPEKKQERFIEPVRGHAFARPGDTDQFTTELAPGTYGYVCFAEAPDGKPHALLGMYGEFTVA